MLLSLWRRRVNPTTRSRQRGHRPDVRFQARRRLQLEALEERMAPATHTWTGAASNLWSNNANWTGGSPAGDASADLVFPGTAANLTNMNDLTGLTIQSISFSGMIGADNTISGNGITLSKGISFAYLNTATTFFMRITLVGITLAGSQTITNSTSNPDKPQLEIDSPINLGAFTLTFTGPGASYARGAITGTGGLVINNVGDFGFVALSGANTYSGLTEVDHGELDFQNNDALGSTAGSVVVNSGGEIRFPGRNNSTPKPVTINGNGRGSGAISFCDTTDGTFAGPISLGSASTIASSCTISTTFGPLPVGTAIFTGPINNNGFDLTLRSGNDINKQLISGVISGVGGLVKDGAGTVTLSSNNTYTGLTKVMAGTLLVNGVQPSSNATINSGGTLGGSGTVGTITAAGTVSPGGPGPGILRGGNTLFNAGSALAVKLNGTTAGTGYDQLNVTGAVSLSGSPTLNVTAVPGLAVGSMFTIIASTDLVGGTFSGLPNNALLTAISGQEFRINYNGNSVVLTLIRLAPTVALTSSVNPSVVGQPVVFTATVRPVPPATVTPTGTVTFRDGATTLGTVPLDASGQAAFTTSTLPLGPHMITAVYSGDSIYNSFTSAPLTQGVAHLWTGGSATTSNWSDNANWMSGAPTEPSAVLLFPSSAARLTNTNDLTGLSIQSITFSGSGYAINGNDISLAGGITADASATGTNTFNANIMLASSQTFTVSNAGATLTLAGGLRGSAGLTKAGAGTLVLAAPNTYTGGTTLGLGTLIVGNNGALGTGTLALNGGIVQSNGPINLNNPFTVGGMATVGGSNDLTFTGSGNLNAGSMLTVTNTATTTFSGNLSGAGALTEAAGTGTLVLSSFNTYTGTTTLTAGTLSADNFDALGKGTLVLNGGVLRSSHPGGITLSNSFTVGGAVTLGGSQSLSFSGPGGILNAGSTLTVTNTATTSFSTTLSGAGALTLAAGTGMLQLSSANSTYTGTTTLTSGTLSVSGISPLGMGPLALNGGTIEAFGDATLSNSFTVGGSVEVSGIIGNITFTGPGTLTAGSTLTSTSLFTTTFAGILSGAGALTQATTLGTLVLSAANIYTGATTVNSGTLRLGAANAIPPLSAVTVAAGTLDLNNLNDTIGSLSGSGSVTLGSGTLTTGGNNTSTTFNGTISGTGGLTKTGTGTLTIASANSYTGGTTLIAGSLAVGNNTALGTGPLALNGGIIQSTAAVTLANPFTVSGAVTVGGSNNITFTGSGILMAGSTLTVSNTGTTTFTGNLSGAGSLTKAAGAGTLTLSGNNTYTGTTTLNSGTLTVDKNTALGTGMLALNGGTLQSNETVMLPNPFTVTGPATLGGSHDLTFTGSITLGTTLLIANTAATITLSGPLSGSGGLTKEGAGRLVLSGANTYTGPTLINGGLVLVTGTQPSSRVTVRARGTLAGTGTVGSVIVIGGTVHPGSSPGILSTAGDVSFDAVSSFAVDVDGTMPGSGHGQLAVTGGVNLGGSTLNVAVGFVPAFGDRFAIVTSTTAITGTFQGLPEGTTVNFGQIPFGVHYEAKAVMLISKARPTTTTLSPPATPPVFGQAVAFTANVNVNPPAVGTATGSVTFIIDGTSQPPVSLSGGRATFAPGAPLAVGGHTLRVSYGGDGDLLASTSRVVTQTVDKAATTMLVMSSVNPAHLGQAITFTAVVTVTAPGAGTPTGSVVFTLDGRAQPPVGLSDGRAALPSPAGLAVGRHAVRADYTGDGNFLASRSDELTQEVTSEQRNPSRTVLTTSANPVGFRVDVTLTANVQAVPPAPGTPTGTVTFQDGATVLGTGLLQNGQAQLTTAALDGGDHALTAVYGGDGNFLDSTSVVLTQTVTPPTPNQRFVDQVFQELLERTVDNPSLPGLTDLLAKGLAPEQFVQTVEGSREYRSLSVQGLYEVYLHRPADAAGLNSFVDSGAALQDIRTILVNSGEYFQDRAGGSNDGFVNTLYRDALGREADPVGLAFFTGQLARGVPRGQVAEALFSSGEYRASLVRSFYRRFLGREADGGGLNAFVAALAQRREDEVLAQVAGSGEAFAGPAVPSRLPNRHFVDQVAQDLLKRAAEPAETAAETELLAQGRSREQVVRGLADGAEYRAAMVGELYVRYLGRPADAGGLSAFAALLKHGGTIEQVRAQLLGSGEYFSGAGGTNDGFLRALYLAALGRALDAGGAAAWSQFLATGGSREAVAEAVLTSREGREYLVNGGAQGLYQRYLRRAGDSGGVGLFVNALLNGARDEDVIAALVGSDEYFTRR
jgi:autotransporter-associated beta strand protein